MLRNLAGFLAQKKLWLFHVPKMLCIFQQLKKGMKTNNFNIRIGGEAGYGIMNTALAFAKFCTRSGLYCFLTHEYPSLVRGGHNTSTVRASDEEVSCHSKEITILAALNKETIELHYRDVEKNGIIFYDADDVKDVKLDRKDVQLVHVPYVKISTEICKKRLLSNSVIFGAAVGLLDGDLKTANDILKEMYSDKGKEIVGWNLKAVKMGYEYVNRNFKGKHVAKIKKISSAKRYVVSGNDAVGLGAIAAGCKLWVQYPMTPTSQILSFMASHAKDYGVLVVQPEDEIASVHMAMGASHAGVRAVTSTSGGGFALMTEALSMAGMAEIPVVIVEGQRGGPSTGLPTRHEQADLRFAANAGHGDFVKIVFAPADVEDAFYSTAEALNLAEKFQVPVILMVDKYLCISSKSTDRLDYKKIKIERGDMISDAELSKAINFKRYNFNTQTGVSPRSIPGQKNGFFNAASDEHDEYGQLIEDPETRIKIMQKRMKKIEFIKKEFPKPELFGDKGAGVTLVGWGSTKGAIREAIKKIKDSAGISINHLHVKYMVPFQSEEIKNILNGCGRVIIIEDNYTGQLASLIMENTGFEIKEKILKYDGKQFSAEELYKKVMEAVNVRH